MAGKKQGCYNAREAEPGFALAVASWCFTSFFVYRVLRAVLGPRVWVVLLNPFACVGVELIAVGRSRRWATLLWRRLRNWRRACHQRADGQRAGQQPQR